MHELHELGKCLLVTSQRLIYERDHIRIAPGNHLAVFATLIAIEDLFYAYTNRLFGPSSWVARFALENWECLGGFL